MLRYIANRLLGLIPVLIGVSLLVFLSVWVIPGDVVDVMMGDEMAQSAAAIERLRAQMNLDEPIHIRYLTWIGNVLQGDLGVSAVQVFSLASVCCFCSRSSHVPRTARYPSRMPATSFRAR